MEANPVAPYAGAWIETGKETQHPKPTIVAPYAGAWIETSVDLPAPFGPIVAPYAGAWIETLSTSLLIYADWSLPTRERGLKQQAQGESLSSYYVAPYAGAWIETDFPSANHFKTFVAPYAGAWIETSSFSAT